MFRRNVAGTCGVHGGDSTVVAHLRTARPTVVVILEWQTIMRVIQFDNVCIVLLRRCTVQKLFWSTVPYRCGKLKAGYQQLATVERLGMGR